MRAVCYILIALIGASAADLCSWCTCTKEGENITVVYCKCVGEEHKTLVLDQENVKNLTGVQNITITSCSSVELKPKAFSELHKLDSLTIDAADEALIPSDVFNKLSFLMISGVKNLKLNEKSLQNVNSLGTIFIKNTHITTLPQNAIDNLPELTKLMLESVKIGQVQKGAIQLSMNKATSVLIEFSEIQDIQEAGIVCSSINEFTLMNSTVKSAVKNSISIVAHNAVNITNNILEDKVTSDSFNVTSKSVSVTGNVVHSFPAGLLSDEGPTLSFTNNQVLDPDWDLILSKSSVKMTFMINKFVCKCSKKEKMNVDKGSPELQSLLDTNYCHSPCNLSLKRLPEACQKVSNKDDEICKIFDVSSTTAKSAHRTDISSTTARPTKQTYNRGDSIFTSSLLSIALSSLIFTIL